MPCHADEEWPVVAVVGRPPVLRRGHDGEEVLLFLDRIDTGDFRVTGFSQGKFEIERDPVSGEAFVKRPMIEGAEVLGVQSQMDGDPSVHPKRAPLDQFINDALGRK